MKDIVSTAMTGDQLRASVLCTLTTPETRRVVDDFHRLYYSMPGTWGLTHYRGLNVMKSPMDLWAMQDVLWTLKPSLVIETGTAFGGSALFYGDCLERNGRGTVLTIDLDVPQVTHPRVCFLGGSSLNPKVIACVAGVVQESTGPVVEVLDSDHGTAHVAAELAAYADFVTVGSVLVVEDTNICGHPVERDWMGGTGPKEAVDAFLAQRPDFVREPILERSLLTFHPGGWLTRVA